MTKFLFSCLFLALQIVEEKQSDRDICTETIMNEDTMKDW